MWPAFPASDYYGSSAPTRRHQPTTSLPSTALDAARVGDRPMGSHVHCRTARRARCPAMPLRPCHSYAADLHRGLPGGDLTRPRSSPTRHHRVDKPLTSPYPPGWSWWVRLRGVQALVPHAHRPVMLAEPGPSGSAGPPRRCRGCLLPFSPVPEIGLPPASPRRCDDTAAKVSHLHSVQQRPRGARCR